MTRPAASSLWAATARPAVPLPRLVGDAQADVVIIGAGYTGLSAAHALAAGGQAPLVLDAETPGWGASGRNGGVVTAKFRPSFSAIARRHGTDAARRMYGLAQEAVDTVGELVDTYAIADAAFARTGQVKAAHNAETLRHAVDEADWLRVTMGSTGSRVLSRAEVRAETGSDAFVGGVLNEGSGGIHPLNYLRGLLAGLAAKAVPIYAETPALRLRREGDGVLVETPEGSVRARQVIIATNGYSDSAAATRPVGRRLVPFRSAIIATEPLTGNLAAATMPTRRTYTETKRMMRWFRMVDDRVVFGGRGAFGKADSEAAFRALRRAMVGLFPALADVPLAYRWSGLVAMTLDALPHIGRLDDRTLFAVGYNGAGVAMSSLMGRYLAAFARGEEPDVGLLSAQPLRRIPFYPLREPAIRAVAGWYGVLDALGR